MDAWSIAASPRSLHKLPDEVRRDRGARCAVGYYHVGTFKPIHPARNTAMKRLDAVTRIHAWTYGLALTFAGFGIAFPFRADLIAAVREYSSPLGIAVLCVLGTVVSGVVHEAVHAAGFMLGARVPISKIAFGWRTTPALQLYMCVNVPVALGGFRLGMLAPAVLVGLVPVLVGASIASPLLVVVGASNLAGCGNDLAVVLSTLRLSAKSKIEMDLEGFSVVE
jgi:hypothetical protein